MYSGSSASENAVVGYQAGYHLREGQKNAIMGYQAGYNLRDTDEHVAIGYKSLYTLESLGGDGYDYGQSRTTAVGAYAGDEITSGERNVAVGYGAVGAAAGNSNTGIGSTIKQITCGDGDTTALHLSDRNLK